MSSGMRRLGRDSLIKEAMAVLARAPGASMAEVAAEIGVGRTTLYRHFGDRETMIAEVARLGARMFGDAFMSAGPESGTGLDAVERVCGQLFTVPDVLTLMFADHPIITDDVFAEVERERLAEAARRPGKGADPGRGGRAATGSEPSAFGEDPLEAVIRRGQGDGSITAEVPVQWAAMYVFLTVGSGHLYGLTAGEAGEGAAGGPAALDLTIRAIRRTLGAGGDGPAR
jgi:AcrR family transcriptional regulator